MGGPLTHDAIADFVATVTRGQTGVEARVALFDAVRNCAYATDSAHDAPALVRTHRGDCLAKSDLLRCGIALLGLHAERVRWLYYLPDQPPEVSLLPTRLDLHSAVEVIIGERRCLVDATHDPPLRNLGLTVSAWDGYGSTLPAYPPASHIWREGEDTHAIDEALRLIQEPYQQHPVTSHDYQLAFNLWLDRARDGWLE